MKSNHLILIFIFILSFCIQTLFAATLEKGDFTITVSQENLDNIQYKVNINSKLSDILKLTQSSRVKIDGKLFFSQKSFIPQFVSFRLKHASYQNLTQPVIAKYDYQNNQYHAEIDLGDPKQIKPFSDTYQLEAIIADQNLSKNIKKIIADCQIKFRKSWTEIPSSDLIYKTEKIIEISAPAQRVDPPKLFTLFVVVLILILDGIFIFGLKHLKVNISHLPKQPTDLFKNVLFLVILMTNLAILLKFYINWTFLQTVQYLGIIIVPTAFIANFALVKIRKN